MRRLRMISRHLGELGEQTSSGGGSALNPGGGGAGSEGGNPVGGGAGGGMISNADPTRPNGAGRFGSQVASDNTPSTPWPEKKQRSSPTTFNRPVVRPERAFFCQIPILAAGTGTNSGEAAWYGLRRLKVPYDTGGEVSLSGLWARMLPPDYGAAGNPNTTPLAWGTARGGGAAIVVGVGLPIQLGAWTSAAAYIPDLDSSSANNATLDSGRFTPPNNQIVIPFPPGNFDSSASAPNIFAGPIPMMGGAIRVTVNQTLDVAFVVGRQYVTGQTNKIIYGLGDVTMFLSPVDIEARWAR